MLGETQGIRTIDASMCEKFLLWVEQTPNEEKMANYKNILKSAQEVPFETFVSGLKSMAGKLDPLENNPIARLTTNPVGIFQTGLLLGYCMSMASARPDFAQMLEDLQNKTKNVTPISAAKGFSK